MISKFHKIDQVLSSANHIYVLTHAKPDGDAIGSLCAMIGYLKMKGVSYTVYSADPVPHIYTALPWVEEVRTPEHTLWNISVQPPDVVILLDVCEISRTGVEHVVSKIPKTGYTSVIFDHHLIDKNDAEYAIIEPTSASTTELLYDFYVAVEFPISAPLAQSLLMGIITDTENFTNRGTTKHTLDVVQQLIHSGAEIAKLTDWSYSKSLSDLKNIGQALSELMYNPEYGIVVTVLQQNVDNSVSQSSTGGLVNFMKRISCGNCVISVREVSEGIKVSLRSQHDNIDVRRIAQYGGGGGHKLAAGFIVKGTLQHNGTHWEVV